MLTKAQEDYFKDSQLRNSDGELVSCFHYTNKEFDSFDKEHITEDSYCGRGFYFTSREDFGRGFGKNVCECYINMENPLILDSLSYSEKVDILDYFANSEAYKNCDLPRIAEYPQKWEENMCYFLNEQLRDNDMPTPYLEDLREELLSSSDYECFLESGNIEDLEYTPAFAAMKRNSDFMELMDQAGLVEYIDMTPLRDSDLEFYNFHRGNWNDFSALLTEYAKENGYDGILIEQNASCRITEIVVFEPNQIKSVDNLYPTKSDNFRNNAREYMRENMGKLTVKEQLEVTKQIPSTIKEHGKDRNFGHEIGRN